MFVWCVCVCVCVCVSTTLSLSVHWADLEPSEPEPPFEEAPTKYISIHRMVKINDRRSVRYRMLPFKREKKKVQQKTTSQEIVTKIMRNSRTYTLKGKNKKAKIETKKKKKKKK